MSTPFVHSSAALVDAHCHIDLYKDPAGIAAQANERRVFTIAVTNAPSVFRHTALLAAESKYVRAAVGLHPDLVSSHAHELDLMLRLLPETRYVGEIGLDYTTPDEDLRQNQREILRRVLDCCASYGDKVLTLHSRRAAADVIDAVGPRFPGRAILHWFSGSIKELEKASEYGFFFSVNPAMIRSAKGQALIARMPADRVITETDGPFVKTGMQPACPWDVMEAAAYLASAWNLSIDEAREHVFQNFRKLLDSI
jgi:TatD DNase family protein